MRISMLALLVMLFIPSYVMADGGITVTNSTLGGVKVAEIYWSSLTNRSDGTTESYNGQITRITVKPLTTLTNKYCVVLTDKYGVGIDVGITSNQTYSFCPTVDSLESPGTNRYPSVVDGSWTVAVTNTGIGQGLIAIFYKSFP